MSSYKKFVAGAATATLVASAIAPVAAAADSKDFTDVNDRYKDAVDYVVSKGVNGLSETQFGVQQNIKRVDAAVFIAKALELDGANSPDSGFTDVPARAAKSVNALKEAKLINGKTATKFGAEDNLTRGEVSLILQKAYDLKGNANNVKFTDVSNRYLGAVAGMLDAKVTSGISETKFGTENPVKRGDLAIWLYKLKDHDTNIDGGNGGETGASGITNVKSINDTKIEVTFGKAIDKAVAREIEKEVERFIGFNGGQTIRTPQDDLDFKVTYVTFTDDYKKAELTLSESPKEDINYTIALMDGEDNTVADQVYKSKPTVLKESAGQPSVSVDNKQEKLVLDFKTKMKDSAKDLGKFEIVDEYGQKIKDADGNTIETLEDILADGSEADWVDSTAKSKVEFKLKPGSLEAGKTYKVKVGKGIVTDKGDELSDKRGTITVKTPSVNDSRPVAKIVRLNKDSIKITFDRDLSEDDADINLNSRLLKVKTATGKDFDVDFDNIEVEGKTVTIPALSGKEFDVKSSYTVSVPENAFANDMFRNALSKEVKNVKAKAQANIAVSSMKAAFERQVDNKNIADLLLTFDQGVKVPTESFEITIEEAGKSTTLSIDPADLELDTDDVEGKTLRLKDFTKALKENEGSIKEIKDDKTYTIKVAAGKVTTDSADENKNSKELKTTVKGINVTAPTIDSVEYVSEEKIVVEFKQEISTDLDPEDVTVQGFQIQRAGKFEQIALNDKNYIKVSVSGKKVTITPADKDIKFITGEEADGVEQAVVFKANAVKAKGSDIVADTELTTADLDGEDVTDNAKPVIIGTTVTGDHNIEVTYSENVEFQDNASGADAYNQFSFEGLEYNNYKLSSAAVTGGNKVAIEFEDQDDKYGPVFDLDKSSFPDVKVIYRAHSDYGLQDQAEFNKNKAKSETFKGAGKASDTTTGGGNNGGETNEIDTKPLKDAIAEAEKLNKEDYTPETWTNFDKALAGAKEALKNKEDQESVDKALSELKEAQDKLVKEDEGEKPVTGKDLKVAVETPLAGTTNVILKEENLTKEQLEKIITTEFNGKEYTFEKNEYVDGQIDIQVKEVVTQEQAEKLVINFK